MKNSIPERSVPTSKVSAYTVGAALAALISAVLASYGLPITPDLTVAISIICGFLLAYFVPGSQLD